jgi:hypothetical protein
MLQTSAENLVAGRPSVTYASVIVGSSYIYLKRYTGGGGPDLLEELQTVVRKPDNSYVGLLMLNQDGRDTYQWSQQPCDNFIAKDWGHYWTIGNGASELAPNTAYNSTYTLDDITGYRCEGFSQFVSGRPSTQYGIYYAGTSMGLGLLEWPHPTTYGIKYREVPQLCYSRMVDGVKQFHVFLRMVEVLNGQYQNTNSFDWSVITNATGAFYDLDNAVIIEGGNLMPNGPWTKHPI